MVETLFIENKIKPTWSNIFSIFKVNEKLTEFVIEFINKNYSKLADDKDFHEKNAKSERESHSSFEVQLIKCSNLTDAVYDSVIKSLYFNWRGISINKLNKKKVLSLLEYNKLLNTKANWESIKKYDDHNVRKKYLEVHLLSILNEENTDLMFEVQDFEVILEKSSYKEKQQEFAVDFISEADMSSDKLRTNIIALFDNRQIPDDILSGLIQHSNHTQRIQLIKNQIDFLDTDTIFSIIELMDEPYCQLADVQDEKIQFEKSNSDTQFLRTLEKKGMILSLKLKKNKLKRTEYYLTRRTKRI